jgi:hypothetical protein
MESFEDIRKKDIENLTGELGTLAGKLIELGWSRDQVLAHVKQLLNNPTDTGKED